MTTNRWFITRGECAPRRHLAMPGDIPGCHNQGGTGEGGSQVLLCIQYRIDLTTKQDQPQGCGAGFRPLAAESDKAGLNAGPVCSLLPLGPRFSLRPVSRDRGFQRCGRGKITCGFCYTGILGACVGCYFLCWLLPMKNRTEQVTQVA